KSSSKVAPKAVVAVPLARCSGSAVKIRHCPATVSDASRLQMPLPLKRWEGAIALSTRRESGDRSAKLRAKAHCPLFLGQRRTLMFNKGFHRLRSKLSLRNIVQFILLV